MWTNNISQSVEIDWCNECSPRRCSVEQSGWMSHQSAMSNSSEQSVSRDQSHRSGLQHSTNILSTCNPPIILLSRFSSSLLLPSIRIYEWPRSHKISGFWCSNPSIPNSFLCSDLVLWFQNCLSNFGFPIHPTSGKVKNTQHFLTDEPDPPRAQNNTVSKN